MLKICLVALGCPKNIVEGENIAGILQESGYFLTTDLNNADIAVVHTCSFITDARDESATAIRRLSSLKKRGKLLKLVVSGCLVQGEGNKLISEFPYVDNFIGTGEISRLPLLLENGIKMAYGKPGGLLESLSPRLLSSRLPTAYLKISEGCNNRCSFCVIPKLRGRYHSRSMESIEMEARSLSDNGIRELVLIAQDTSYYGKDIYGRLALPELLKKLAKIDGFKWIRLLYAHPSSVNESLVEVMRGERKICKYIDIPLQHVNDKVLRKMGRPVGVRKFIYKLKKNFPELQIRSTFIVGFPGENKDAYHDLHDFIGEGLIDQMGVFEYSQQPGTSSSKMWNYTKISEIRDRKRELMLKQREIVARKNKDLINCELEVIVENSEEKKYNISGRTSFQAPDIDSKIFLKGSAKIGSFVRAKITGSRGYDLTGEVLKR